MWYSGGNYLDSALQAAVCGLWFHCLIAKAFPASQRDVAYNFWLVAAWIQQKHRGRVSSPRSVSADTCSPASRVVVVAGRRNVNSCVCGPPPQFMAHRCGWCCNRWLAEVDVKKESWFLPPPSIVLLLLFGWDVRGRWVLMRLCLAKRYP